MTRAQEAWEVRKEANAAFLHWITGAQNSLNPPPTHTPTHTYTHPHTHTLGELLLTLFIVVASEGIWPV